MCLLFPVFLHIRQHLRYSTVRHHGYASCLLHRRLVQCLIQLFRICIPLCRINCKSLHQNSFFLRCDHKSHRRWRHKSVLLCPLDGMRHLHPGHASIHRRTKRIYIGIRSNLRSRCHLFDWRISTLLHAEIIIISIHSRSAKINQLHLSVMCDHDIVRADIPVDHTAFMYTRQRTDNRTHDCQSLGHR